MNNAGKFSGVLMTCVVCGATLRSHPEAESNWRCLEIDASDFWACPAEFPSDGATKEKFEAAYSSVIACCLSEILIRKGLAGEPKTEVYRAYRRNRMSHKKKSQGFSGL